MAAQSHGLALSNVALLFVAAACGDGDNRPRQGPFDVEYSVDQPVVDPKTPHFFMERTSERCEVFIERSGSVTEKLPERFACPKDLELGESIRLLGRTCMRVSPVPARRLPVLCPDYLTTAESDARASASAARTSPSSRSK